MEEGKENERNPLHRKAREQGEEIKTAAFESDLAKKRSDRRQKTE